MWIIGNCYLCAKLLQTKYGGEIINVPHEFGSKGKAVKHYLLKDKNGTIRHFQRKLDILPGFLGTLIYIGKIEQSKRNKE